MTDKQLANALHRITTSGGNPCPGCGHEHNCGSHGCAIVREAAARIEYVAEFQTLLMRKFEASDSISRNLLLSLLNKNGVFDAGELIER